MAGSSGIARKRAARKIPDGIPALARDYAAFFDVAQRRRKNKSWLYQNAYFCALDAEWVERGGRNVVLSYQTATLSRSEYCNKIHYVRQGDRLTLTELVERAIRSVNGGHLPEDHRDERTVVVLVAHNTVAEWSVLADRDAPHITKRLVAIRKSPVTTRPIPLVLPGNFPVDVNLFDSMLLAPASHRSLKKLSSLLGSEEKAKKDIPEKVKKRMDLFLEDHPAEYEEYALRDTSATLEIFLLLQSELNRQAFERKDERFDETKKVEEYRPKRLFKTLASAAVQGFLDREGEWFENYLEDLRSPNFREAFKLIRRAYHGGRGEGYFVGDTREHSETKDKIWLDIDFSGCYPSAMAMVPMIDTMGKIKHRTLTYRLDKPRIAKLRKAGIPEAVIAAAVQGLHDDQTADPADPKKGSYFDLALKVRPKELNIHQARRIRSIATCCDDSLVKDWERRWLEAQQNPEHPLNHSILPGFARVRFEFPRETEENKGTIFPCLPVRHPKYGLLFPLSGESTATAPEILLALQMGARIEVMASVELPVATEENSPPYRYFLGHLSGLIKKRKELENQEEQGDLAAGVGAKLLKEFVNSFYGKTAQAINPRKVYRPATGEMVPLFTSPISEPSVAAMVTGLARAALSAVLAAIEVYNEGKDEIDRVSVMSATTDGLLIGIKAPPGYSVTDKFYTVKKPKDGEVVDPNKPPIRKLLKDLDLQKVLGEFGYGDFWTLLERYLPLRLMQQARIELTKGLTKDDDVDESSTEKKISQYLEIKHAADWIVSVKTRGQLGFLNTGEASLLAKFGHKVPLSEYIEDEDEYRRVFEDDGMLRPTKEAEWLLAQIAKTREHNALIHRYPFYGLHSFGNIYKSEEPRDLTQTRDDRRFNSDYDWKRRIVREGESLSPLTMPHKDVQDMLRHRNQMESIRRAGYVAHPEKVLHRVAVKGRKARYRHGEPATMVRQFLRGCRHGHIPSDIPQVGQHPAGARWHDGGTALYHELADRLNLLWERSGLAGTSRKRAWSRDDFKNAGRKFEWEPGILLRTPPLVELLRQLAVEFGADPMQAEQQIFAGEEHLALHRELVAQVVVAVLHAGRERVVPFTELAEKGVFPDRGGLLQVFAPHLTEHDLALCERAKFHPGQRPPQDRQRLTRLFRQLGLGAKEAALCVRPLIQPMAPGRRRKNPSEATCLEQFLVAIQQPDLVPPRALTATKVLGRLARYNVSYSQYRRLQGVKFAPKTLANSSANMEQIKTMATRLDLDPVPLIDALLDR